MGQTARRRVLETLSPSERFDLGLMLSDRMVEAYLANLPEPLDMQPGEELTPEKRRRRFQALRDRGR